ncbi:MAG: aminotransferase class V-fold PLP-dependent enzyme [Deltaproteobacteria bacterium]|nr:aminotransferase class V-fold PLP-dependent enzyme [Deltaproteobacteria bacterium]
MDIEPLAGREHFPAIAKSTYLNAASIALMYKGASEAAVAWQRDLAQNGTLSFDEAAEQNVFSSLHQVFANLIGANPRDIAVGSSFTELVASLAWAMMPARGENIVGVDVVFPSTIYPWLRVAHTTGCEIRLLPTADYYADPEELVGLIDDNTAVVAISHVEFASGQRYDLRYLAESAHSSGALLVVDATQSAGAIPIDVLRDGVDILVAAGYKWLCGPFGAAVMYVAPHLQTRFEPGLAGFRSHIDMWDLRADRIQYRDDAGRFEFGTMAYGCALGLAKAIEFILDLGADAVFAHDLELRARLVEGLEQRGAQLLGPSNQKERSPILSAFFPGFSSHRIVDSLKEQGVIVSPRGDFVRFSPHLYNSSDDIDHSIEILDRILGL